MEGDGVVGAVGGFASVDDGLAGVDGVRVRACLRVRRGRVGERG